MENNTNTTETKGKMKILPDMTFGEILAKRPEVVDLLAEEGMFCGGCPMSMMETIEEGAAVHRVDIDKLLMELNRDLEG